MLDVVAAIYLLLLRRNAFAPEITTPIRLRRWSAAFLAVSAVSHVLWILLVQHPSNAAYVAVCCFDILLYFPTIAGILLSMLQDRYRPVWPVAIMLVPAVILTVLYLIRGDNSLLLPGSIYVIAMYVLFLVYMFFAVRRYGRWLRDNYADLEHKEIGLSMMILVVFLLFFVIYNCTTETNKFLMYLLQIDSIIIAGLLLWRVETLQVLTEKNTSEDYAQKSQRTIPDNIGPLLEKHCVQTQLYLQYDLTLAQLAQVIGTNRYYLSQYFSRQGITYNAYINELRVNHFISLYHKSVAEWRIFTAQQLAKESGFHSYSTFSSAFKQITGKTVTSWMRDAEENK